MDQTKGLSAVGYLSFYFAPFIFPLIVFFVAKDEIVKYHNKRAWISQLIPIVLIMMFVVSFFIFAFTDNPNYDITSDYEILMLIGFIAVMIISFGIGIWNLVQAIKVLR